MVWNISCSLMLMTPLFTLAFDAEICNTHKSGVYRLIIISADSQQVKWIYIPEIGSLTCPRSQCFEWPTFNLKAR